MNRNKPTPFNRPHMTGKELYYIAQSHFNGALAGDGPFTKLCHAWLEERTGSAKALLTHSCTAALEMAALLLNIQPGDEILMPSLKYLTELIRPHEFPEISPALLTKAKYCKPFAEF